MVLELEGSGAEVEHLSSSIGTVQTVGAGAEDLCPQQMTESRTRGLWQTWAKKGI